MVTSYATLLQHVQRNNSARLLSMNEFNGSLIEHVKNFFNVPSAITVRYLLEEIPEGL